MEWNKLKEMIYTVDKFFHEIIASGLLIILSVLYVVTEVNYYAYRTITMIILNRPKHYFGKYDYFHVQVTGLYLVYRGKIERWVYEFIHHYENMKRGY